MGRALRLSALSAGTLLCQPGWQTLLASPAGLRSTQMDVRSLTFPTTVGSPSRRSGIGPWVRVDGRSRREWAGLHTSLQDVRIRQRVGEAWRSWMATGHRILRGVGQGNDQETTWLPIGSTFPVKVLRFCCKAVRRDTHRGRFLSQGVPRRPDDVQLPLGRGAQTARAAGIGRGDRGRGDVGCDLHVVAARRIGLEADIARVADDPAGQAIRRTAGTDCRAYPSRELSCSPRLRR